MDNNQIEESINLQEFFSLIWKNIIIIAIITLAITIAVGLYSKYEIEKIYTSNTSIRVTPYQIEDSNNYDNLIATQRSIKTFAYIVKSRTVLDPVIEDLNLGLSTGDLQNSIEVIGVPDTDFLEIKVTLNDPKQASIIANKVADVFIDYIEVKENNFSFEQIDHAIPNNHPVSPNTQLNTIIGFVLGGMLAVGFVLLKEFLNRTIKSEEDVKKLLNVPVLGSVPAIDKKYIS